MEETIAGDPAQNVLCRLVVVVCQLKRSRDLCKCSVGYWGMVTGMVRRISGIGDCNNVT